MGFPTTIQEALTLTPEKAEEYAERLEEMLMDHAADWTPPEEILESTANYMLAAMIDVLNRCNNLPGNPLAPDWTTHIPEEEAEDA